MIRLCSLAAMTVVFALACGKKGTDTRDLTADEIARRESWSRAICECQGKPDPKECSNQVDEQFETRTWPDRTTISDASWKKVEAVSAAGTSCRDAIWGTKR